jgi:hypothetical protein
MNVSCDSDAIEISLSLMGRFIVEMEESAHGQILRAILRPLFIEIGQYFFSTKNLGLSISRDGRRTKLPIPECEKQTQIIIVFAPINCRARVGLAIRIPARMEDRGLA